VEGVVLSADMACAERLAEAAWETSKERRADHGPWRHLDADTRRHQIQAARATITHLIRERS
jgi:hypothetical protein